MSKLIAGISLAVLMVFAAGAGALAEWTTSFEIIGLDTESPDGAVLVTDRLGSTGLLDAGDFELPAESGFALSVGCTDLFAADLGLEARLLLLQDAAAALEPAYSSSFSGAAIAFFTPFISEEHFPVWYSGTYETSLSSFELNVRRNISDRAALLAGVRRIALEDTMGVGLDILSNPENMVTASIDATNELIGLQLGGEAGLALGKRIHLDAALKYGFYRNEAEIGVGLTQEEGPDYMATDVREDSARVGEAAVTLSFRPNDHLTFYAGYRYLRLDGLALACEQIAAADPLKGMASVSMDGRRTYDGFCVGLMIRF